MAHTLASIPKWTTKWSCRKVPDGAPQFDPVSQEWQLILEAKKEAVTPSKKGKGKGGGSSKEG